MTHPTCEDVINHAWTEVRTIGGPMFVLFEKIKQCRMALVGWSRATFGNSKTKLKEKHQILQELSSSNRAENLHEI